MLKTRFFSEGYIREKIVLQFWSFEKNSLGAFGAKSFCIAIAAKIFSGGFGATCSNLSM